MNDLEPSLLIDGRAVAPSRRAEVIDPADERPFASYPKATPEEIGRAVESASRAFPSWSRDEAKRRQALASCATSLLDAADRIAGLICREQGKPVGRARFEVENAARWFKYFAELEVTPEVVHRAADRVSTLHLRPLGVVAAIPAWNFPVALMAWKLAPALRAGNTVVVKPSPFTPIASLAVGHLLASHFPAGVLNVLPGDGDAGDALTQHADVRKISFTGSTATGRRVFASGAPSLKRVTLELGGNDAGIVLADADVAAVAEGIYNAAFVNCGQSCAAIKRLYVHASVHDRLVEALTAIAEGIRVGPGSDPQTQMGPISNAAQLARVEELLADTKRRGARIHTGGERLARPGYFVRPTIVSAIADDARLVAEEQFGPVLPILSFTDAADAVRRANDTTFGLNASVWTSDPEAATPVAAALDVGTAWINQHSAMTPFLPYGGAKTSGVGVEHGIWGLREYAQSQLIDVKLPAPR
ncbi:MAG: aldehyde dehydrogenase family protein [Myxococcota bacterium]